MSLPEGIVTEDRVGEPDPTAAVVVRDPFDRLLAARAVPESGEGSVSAGGGRW